MAILTADIV